MRPASHSSRSTGQPRCARSRSRCAAATTSRLPVADALAALAAGDRLGYAAAVKAVLESFETREAYLEDIPVADTVIVLQALAQRSGLIVELESPLLPG